MAVASEVPPAGLAVFLLQDLTRRARRQRKRSGILTAASKMATRTVLFPWKPLVTGLCGAPGKVTLSRTVRSAIAPLVGNFT